MIKNPCPRRHPVHLFLGRTLSYPACLALHTSPVRYRHRLGQDPQPLDEREERGAEGRVVDLRPHEVPVDLLTERAGDLEHRPVVRLLLAHREKLRREHVVDRRDEERQRRDLHARRAGEVLVGDGAAGRAVDDVDEDLALPRLEKPALGRALGPHARPRRAPRARARRRVRGRGSPRRGPSAGRRTPRRRGRRREGTGTSACRSAAAPFFMASRSSGNVSLGV